MPGYGNRRKQEQMVPKPLVKAQIKKTNLLYCSGATVCYLTPSLFR